MIIEYDINQRFDSFIMSWMIDHDICDQLIQQYEQNKNFASDYIDVHRGYKGITNYIIDKEIASKYSKIINHCMNKYNTRYEWSGMLDTFLSVPYNIQRYEPNNYYNVWHFEDGGPTPGKFVRHLVFLTYLNDIEEGGGTEFLYQEIKVTPRKGLTLMWPAGWTHPHRGIVAPNEIKYITTGWSCYRHRVM